MNCTNNLGLHTSPDGGNFAPDPPQTPEEFLRQNAKILTDAYFQGEIEGLRLKLAEWQDLRGQVEGWVVKEMETNLATAGLEEEPGPLLDSYLFVRDILDEVTSVLQAVIDLCLWLARQYTHRLQMDVDAYLKLKSLKERCRHLEAQTQQMQDEKQKLAKSMGYLRCEIDWLTQRVERSDEVILSFSKRNRQP